MMLFFIHDISRAIGVSHNVARIAADTIPMIDETMPWPYRHDKLDRASTWETTVSSDVSGYIRFVDRKRLVALAKTYRVKINVLRRVGPFVPAGVALLAVSKDGRLTPEGIEDVRGAFDSAARRSRTIAACLPNEDGGWSRVRGKVVP